MMSAMLRWIVRCALLATVISPLQAAEVSAKPQHVFIIVLENEGYSVTFGPKSPAVNLNKLAQQGALLQNYYGIGHHSLDNYIAMISGQAPNPDTQADCKRFVEFAATGTTPDGQAIGRGCVYPKSVSTIANQLEDKTLTWKGYMQDMGNSTREAATCGHPKIGDKDNTQGAQAGDQYASRHDPFVYFHSLIDGANSTCAAHVVNFSELAADLKSEATTPNYVFITPNLCNDGHDNPCFGKKPGGLKAADKFLADNVLAIQESPAFKHDGLLIITFDEADTGDSTSCCNQPRGPNIPPGAKAFGGGRVGAVLLSRFIKSGTVSTVGYNHYSLLRSVEDFFDLAHLGYAGQDGLAPFGKDVFTAQ
jgi:phosphatidylinositol-3-phosphatase